MDYLGLSAWDVRYSVTVRRPPPNKVMDCYIIYSTTGLSLY